MHSIPCIVQREAVSELQEVFAGVSARAVNADFGFEIHAKKSAKQEAQEQNERGT
jgi:hypothetical protein